MTDRKELSKLILAANVKGASVTVTEDSDGHIATLQVEGLRGVGPHPMSPISFAERMREVLAA